MLEGWNILAKLKYVVEQFVQSTGCRQDYIFKIPSKFSKEIKNKIKKYIS